jgi:nucleoside triphosphatase
MPEQLYPEPTTGALIFDKEGRLFLMRSHKWEGKWVIPGGHVDLGERIEDAVRREVKEETNLDVYDVEFVCFQEFIYGDGFWKKKHFIFFDYACKTNSTDVVLNHEAQEYAWVSLDDLQSLPVEAYTWNVIREYLKIKGISLERRSS